MDIREYVRKDGKNPFFLWIEKLDTQLMFRIRARLARIESTNNLGDYKPIKGSAGVFELRFKFGKGYRVYFGKENNKIIILLAGGDKSSQQRDIKKATEYWEDYNA
jgi:putative addiction module killer protein